WTTAVVWDRRHVADGSDGEAGRLQRAQRRFAPRARSRHLDLEGAHAVLLGLLGGVLGGHLRCIGRRFARALEAHGAGRRPGDGVSLRVRYRDHRIVEGRVHMRDSGSNVLAFASSDAGGFFAHSRSSRGRRLAVRTAMAWPMTAPVVPRPIIAGRRQLATALLVLLSGLLLLAGDRLGRTLAGAGIGVGALAADGQPTPMSQPTVAAEVHQPLDV